MDAEAYAQFAERFVVVPAVDVEALRSALRTIAATAGVTVALGPSLLGTLDMHALPLGLHPFVDPDRRVRPLRDDVVLLIAEDDPGHAESLAALGGLADLVERRPLTPGPKAAWGHGVLLLGRAERAEGVWLTGAVAQDPARADELLGDLLATWFDPMGDGGVAVGADLYAVLAPDLLARVLASRDG